MTLTHLRVLRTTALILLTCAGCAESAIQLDDTPFDDGGPAVLSANVLPDGGRGADDAASAFDADGSAPSDDGDAGAARAGDAATTDGGTALAHDASSDAASSDAAGSDAAASCVADQCTAKCGVFKGCCSALNVCACEDLLGLCVLPAI